MPDTQDRPFDALETRAPAVREAAMMQALAAQIAHAKATAPAFATRLAQVDAAAITSRAALATLPVVRKHQVLQAQHAAQAEGGDPFGGFAAAGWFGARAGAAAPRSAQRVFQSPGPLYEPEGAGQSDPWRMARALHAAGFRAGDLAHVSFSYHLTPAGAMMEGGAHRLGCTTFPGGVGHTELQLEAMQALRPQGYVGTPSFLKILMEKAAAPLSVTKALVSGEACPPSLSEWFTAHGVAASQCYATADLGLIAYETKAREGLVLDEAVIVEIVRPGTGEPLPDGDVGELVVTTLNPDYPLIRFGTGDLSAVLPGPCPTGRTNTRIKGWMGRADQTVKVRGMFVHPGQIAEVVRRFAEVGRARLTVEGEMANDRMRLAVEVAGAPEGLAERIAETLRDVTKLRGEVACVAPGSLPNDGKVIEDLRSLD